MYSSTRTQRDARGRSAMRRCRLSVFAVVLAASLFASSTSSAQLPSLLPPLTSTVVTYHTVFYPPKGAPITRDTTGVITPLIPIKVPIDVDKNNIPDLSASTTINAALDTVTVSFSRMLGDKSRLKLSVEVIATPPSTTGLPREKVHFGYYAGGGAPKEFKGTIRFLKAAKSLKSPLASDTIVADYTASPPPPKGQSKLGIWSLRVLGGLFNGAADKRTDVLGGSMTYLPNSGPKPLKAGIGLSIPPAISDKAPLVIRHADNRRAGSLIATVTDQAAGRNATATIGGVPKDLTVQLGDQQLNYTASARVNSIGVTANLGNGAQRGQPHFIRVKARDLPTNWRAFLGGDERVGFATLSAGRGIGELAVAADDVSPAKLPADTKNALALTMVPGAEFYAGARLFNVRKAIYASFSDSKFISYEFDAAQPRPLNVSAALGPPGSSTALKVGVREPPRTLSITSPNKGPTKFQIEASARIPKLELELVKQTVEAPGNLNLSADIQHIPPKVEFCLASNFDCGRRQDVVGRQTDLTWKAEQLFDLLSDVSMSVNTRGTAKKNLQIDLTLCSGPGSRFTATGCHREPTGGLHLGVRDMRFRDIAFTFGGGSSCPPGVVEDGLVLMALDTDSQGLSARGIAVDTLSPKFQDCYGVHDAERTFISSKMPDPVRAQRYATIIDVNGNPDDDLEGVGSIQCPSSFNITVSGWISKYFNAADFLDDC